MKIIMKGEIKVLISKEEINQKIKGIALKIKKDFKEGVYCIVVLTGAMTFFKDLEKELRLLGLKVESSTVRLSSYKDTESIGKVNIVKDIRGDITGKDMLVIEDIVDTGLTLNFLKEHLLKKGAKSVKICALLDKKERRKKPTKIDYVGFDVPNQFIVGYGIDYNEKYRDLNFIGYIIFK